MPSLKSPKDDPDLSVEQPLYQGGIRSDAPQTCLRLPASMRQWISLPLMIMALTVGIAVPSDSHAQASDELIESIMSLRSDVETLYSQLQDDKRDHRANMGSLAAQKADLEAQINRQTISLQQLDLDIAKTRQEIDNTRSQTRSIKPTLMEGQALLREAVAGGLPFKKTERVNDVDELGEKITSEALTEERALSQLWAGFEDVLRMTRENGVFKQEIELDGNPVLVDVVKLGTVALYFRTADGVFGYASHGTDGERFIKAADALEQEQISELFDSMEKQIRTGNFTVPASFLQSGAAS